MAKDDDRQQIFEEFDETVNMTRKELEKWLRTDESKSVGQGEGESKGHESGRRIVGLLEKNKSDYTDDDLDHMKKVNASEDDPRYLVESEKSGKEAAHKPDSLSKA